MLFRDSMLPLWSELSSLQREMNRVFNRHSNGNGHHAAVTYPPVNVWQGDDGIAFTFNLPGYTTDDVEIISARNSLTVRGQRKRDELSEGQTLISDEWHSGPFTRTFELPFSIDPEKTSASFEKGVLRVSLPRPADDKPKKIAIKAGK